MKYMAAIIPRNRIILLFNSFISPDIPWIICTYIDS